MVVVEYVNWVVFSMLGFAYYPCWVRCLSE